ncbi:MAG: prenyltransferase/squalene oxidase repeat-containing protein, partial [Opitutales bacterium]
SLGTIYSTAEEVAADEEETGNPFQKDKVDKAIDKAIAFLMSKQRSDGSIMDRGNPTTMTSLALMAMAAVGNQPVNPDDEGRVMRRGLDFILKESNQDAHGYFGNRDGGRMYGHGIITLMLSEFLGMGLDEEQDQLLRKRCQKAINLILRSQKVRKSPSHQGGWRYSPDSRDADLSVTIWQLMSLRSAKNAGLEVPTKAIEDAVGYLERSYHSRLDAKGEPVNKKSGFAYQPGGHPEYTTTAAGLLAMQVCGEYESPFVKGASDWLVDNAPNTGRKFFFYGTYYYAQGMYQRGGDHAKIARKKVEDIMVKLQRSNGSWHGSGSENSAGQVYSTSMAVLALAVKYHYLPIYQR